MMLELFRLLALHLVDVPHVMMSYSRLELIEEPYHRV